MVPGSDRVCIRLFVQTDRSSILASSDGERFSVRVTLKVGRRLSVYSCTFQSTKTFSLFSRVILEVSHCVQTRRAASRAGGIFVSVEDDAAVALESVRVGALGGAVAPVAARPLA